MDAFFNSLGMAEIPILDFIRNNIACPFLDAVMPFISSICDHGEIWIVWALVLLFIPKTRKTGFAMAIALIMGLVLVNMIMKPAFARIRPYDLAEVALIIDKPHDYSFPSGHTLSCFEAFGAMFMTNKKLGLVALVPAVLITFSRLYLYVHFPTDILGGIVLGLVFAFVAVKITNSIYAKADNKGKTK